MPFRGASNIDGLDLELSQTSVGLGFNQNFGKKDEQIIKKNELLDSLDLNVGMDALMKLQDVWAKNPIRKNSNK